MILMSSLCRAQATTCKSDKNSTFISFKHKGLQTPLLKVNQEITEIVLGNSFSHSDSKTVSSFRFLQAKSLCSYYETRQTINRNRKHRAQQSFGCFI